MCQERIKYTTKLATIGIARTTDATPTDKEFLRATLVRA